MSVKSFISSVKSSLGLSDLKDKGRKKSVKVLMNKLSKKKEALTKALEKKVGKKERKELEEELDIITLQLKKGEKFLAKLKKK